MSLKLGTQDISGISQNIKYNAHHLLDFKWTDCIINDVSWLRADTFSWQSGDVYTSAYNHLVADLQGTTAETETIGSYTVTFYRATDGHKICLADQETTILNIYNESGIAWYYIVDAVNTQFKLPRTKFGFEGLRNNVGDIIEAGLPNITGGYTDYRSNISSPFGAFSPTYTTSNVGAAYQTDTPTGNIRFNASYSSSIYGNSNTVQPPATQMYLYFYVGDYNQTAIEQTAGLNAELFNGKANTDFGNIDNTSNIAAAHLNTAGIRTIVETYINGESWYRVYSDGWCEQGGIITHTNDDAENYAYFLKPFKGYTYYVGLNYITGSGTSWDCWTASLGTVAQEPTYFSSCMRSACKQWSRWYACGYIN